MFLQLWHVGRISDPIYHDGALPVAPSAIAPKGNVSLLRPQRALSSRRAPSRPGKFRALSRPTAGAPRTPKRPASTASKFTARTAICSTSSCRTAPTSATDLYGGAIENRARLLLEVTDAVVSVWGAGRVGLHLAPRADAHDMGDSNLPATFGYVARELGKRKIAFLCARESTKAPRLGPELKAAFGGVYVANEGFTREAAEAVIAAGEADAVAFGKLFLANPDLPRRFALRSPLNAWNADTFYSDGPAGYTDYPPLEEQAAAE